MSASAALSSPASPPGGSNIRRRRPEADVLDDQKQVLLELNNAAVSLLERGQRRDAVVMFQEALLVLKSSNNNNNNAGQQEEDPGAVLDRARKRTTVGSSSSDGANATTAKSNSSSCCDPDDLIVLSSQHDPAEAYRNEIQQHPNASICLIMENDMEVHLVKAMLVYNYGVTHCCVAGHNGGMQHPQIAKLGTLCFQIYQYAESLLSASDAGTEFLLLSLLLTRKLHVLSGNLGLPIHEQYQQNLDDIVAAVTQ